MSQHDEYNQNAFFYLFSFFRLWIMLLIRLCYSAWDVYECIFNRARPKSTICNASLCPKGIDSDIARRFSVWRDQWQFALTALNKASIPRGYLS